jgi:hypothetical protein
VQPKRERMAWEKRIWRMVWGMAGELEEGRSEQSQMEMAELIDYGFLPSRPRWKEITEVKRSGKYYQVARMAGGEKTSGRCCG